MISSENIVAHELIGLETKIVNSSNNQILGLTGIIVDETKSMFVIKTTTGFKKIPKKQNDWKFFVQNQDVILSGSNLCKRSFDRVRLKF
jgi:ribonuclease P protein subunit POP4